MTTIKIGHVYRPHYSGVTSRVTEIENLDAKGRPVNCSGGMCGAAMACNLGCVDVHHVLTVSGREYPPQTMAMPDYLAWVAATVEADR